MKTTLTKYLIFIVSLELSTLTANAQVINTRYGDYSYPSFTGAGNSAFGSYTLNANTNGNYNTAIGAAALYRNTSGSSNTAVGRWSLYSNTTGLYNTSLGSMSMWQNTAGVENSAVGMNSLMRNTWGSYNSAFGMNSLTWNTSGLFNAAYGAYSMFNNSSGGSNAAIGTYAMYSNSNGSENVAAGMYALYYNQTGISNTGIGYFTLPNNQSGSNNTAVGHNTGGGIAYGSGNTIIGANVSGLPNTLTNTIILADGTGNQRLVIDNTGKARIGSNTLTTPGAYKLYVEQGILTEKVVVAIANTAEWADYVFAPGYRLAPLGEVAKFVSTNHHLPNVPSAVEVVKNGVNLAAMDAKLLEKIEELTLYIIELESRITSLEEKK